MEAIADAFGRLERPPAALDALNECMGHVPEKSLRLLAQVRYAEALSMEKIAAAMRVGVAAAYKALARLRSKLRDCVAPPSNPRRMIMDDTARLQELIRSIPRWRRRPKGRRTDALDQPAPGGRQSLLPPRVLTLCWRILA